jgi:PadR family transcriptional regulator, regulatory protein PadR
MSQSLDVKEVLPPSEQNDFLRLSSLDETILILLSSHKELYGLQIVKAFDEVSGGKKQLSIGTLYPVLGRLEKQKLITSKLHDGSTLAKGGARRKFFKITESGALALSKSRSFKNDMYQWRPAYGETAWAT